MQFPVVYAIRKNNDVQHSVRKKQATPNCITGPAITLSDQVANTTGMAML